MDLAAAAVSFLKTPFALTTLVSLSAAAVYVQLNWTSVSKLDNVEKLVFAGTVALVAFTVGRVSEVVFKWANVTLKRALQERKQLRDRANVVECWTKLSSADDELAGLVYELLQENNWSSSFTIRDVDYTDLGHVFLQKLALEKIVRLKTIGKHQDFSIISVVIDKYVHEEIIRNFENTEQDEDTPEE